MCDLEERCKKFKTKFKMASSGLKCLEVRLSRQERLTFESLATILSIHNNLRLWKSNLTEFEELPLDLSDEEYATRL